MTQALDADGLPVSGLIRKAIRVARLRSDIYNLWWLEWELLDITQRRRAAQIYSELGQSIDVEASKELIDSIEKTFVDDWISERTFYPLDPNTGLSDQENVCTKSVPDIENDINTFQLIADESHTPDGLPYSEYLRIDSESFQVRNLARHNAANFKSILNKIRDRVLRYLHTVERELRFAKINSDIFEIQRKLVDAKLAEICPEAMEMFTVAYNRMEEGGSEDRAHALTSCRRLLKALADKLYPPTNEPVVGADGKGRKLGDDQYINRLWEFASERIEGRTSGKVLHSQLKDFGKRIDTLYELSNKGVHAEVSPFEVRQCVIQTYILIGDLLSLTKLDSGKENSPVAT